MLCKWKFCLLQPYNLCCTWSPENTWNECHSIGSLIDRVPGWKRVVRQIEKGKAEILDRLISVVRIYALIFVFFSQITAYIDGYGPLPGRLRWLQLFQRRRINLRCTAPSQQGVRSQEFIPKIPPRGSKSAYRGFLHPQIAEMLCPIYHLEMLQRNNQYIFLCHSDPFWHRTEHLKNSVMGISLSQGRISLRFCTFQGHTMKMMSCAAWCADLSYLQYDLLRLIFQY